MSTGIVNLPASSSGHYTCADIAGPAWRPRGVLTAHLNEHRAAVNRLAVARGGAFFASASNDETVKVWDLRRLEKDVTFHSRLTYAAQVRGLGGGGEVEGCIWEAQHTQMLVVRALGALQVSCQSAASTWQCGNRMCAATVE